MRGGDVFGRCSDTTIVVWYVHICHCNLDVSHGKCAVCCVGCGVVVWGRQQNVVRIRQSFVGHLAGRAVDMDRVDVRDVHIP